MLKSSGMAIFSTDMYRDNSVKAMERRRRGCGEKLIIKGELTRKPIDWKVFLEWVVTEELFAGVEEFTCAIYGRPRVKSIDTLHFILINERSGDEDRLQLGRNVDLATLPPCLGVLQQHIRRAIYHVAIWRRANITVPDVPLPTDGHGWTISSTGHLLPLWVDGPILPQVLVDEVEGLVDSGDSDDGESGIPH